MMTPEIATPAFGGLAMTGDGDTKVNWVIRDSDTFLSFDFEFIK